MIFSGIEDISVEVDLVSEISWDIYEITFKNPRCGSDNLIDEGKCVSHPLIQFPWKFKVSDPGIL